MKITIAIPNSFRVEREYTFKVLFSYFNEVDISFTSSNTEGYVISDQKGNNFFIEDHFWSLLDEDKSTKEQYQIPKYVSELSILFGGVQCDLITIFGYGEIDVKNGVLESKADLIASAFFMLTRWEESVCTDRDKHDRFPDESSLAIRMKFHERPIVNEYIEFIRLVLSKWKESEVHYNRVYSPLITHDVDEITRLFPLSKFVKVLLADSIRRKSARELFRTIRKGMKVLINPENDDSWTFDELIEASNFYGLKSHFYFIPGEKKELDFRYRISHRHTKKVIKSIIDARHVVGIHPSYRVKEDIRFFEEELQRLRKVSNVKIDEGRHHYLRINLPDTLRMWNRLEMKYDSSIGYNSYIGFRSGISYPYPFFDFEERKEMNLIERPLIAMDVALLKSYPNKEDYFEAMQRLSKIVRKYNGEFVFLWHNNNIYHPHWRDVGKHYYELVAIIA